MAKIPFNVSARTARLIGRENVSNADGAVIELVKNSYDADASICLLFFKNLYPEIPEKLSEVEFAYISKQKGFLKISNCYEKIDNNYRLKLVIPEKSDLKSFFNTLIELYIADNGSGMSIEVLKNQWMTIGTDNKAEQFISKKNRIQTGAKGIGRFALDKLGSNCEVITKNEESDEGYILQVNWEDFEKKNESISNVFADLEIKKNFDFRSVLSELIQTKDSSYNNLLSEFNHGTILKITNLRDVWSTENINNIYKVLESLTPPGVINEFKMYVFDSSDISNFGEVKNFINDDYDYFFQAKFDETKKLTLKVYRREFDYSKIDKRLFQLPTMKEPPFEEKFFEQGFFIKYIDIQELIPGGIDKFLVDKLGPFDFNFYFIKRQTTEEGKKQFAFRDFIAVNRSEWLKRSGGIRLFRDNFRVRPYGEPNGSSYDWLGLDARAAKSPAGFAQGIGTWRVRNQQVAGEVNISRVTNLNFDDKSSREGIQENLYFKLFKNILIEIISLFERDREHIGLSMKSLYSSINNEESKKKEAKKIIDKLRSDEEKKGLFTESENVDSLKEKLETVAEGYKIKEKEQEELLTEMKMLRTLASSGLLIATFAHELRQLSGTLSRRVELLKYSLDQVIDKEKIVNVASHNDPYRRLERIKEDDFKLKSWIELSIDALQKNKRNRIKINLNNYLKNFTEEINNVVKLKKAKVELTNYEGISEIRAFALDLDSIFNNLIANSITAFLRNDAPPERKIKIGLSDEGNFVVINYSDSGPGLEKSISDPNKIFELFFTTKVNQVGEKVGTGLGLWILKSIVKEYGGEIKFIKIRGEFTIQIYLPKAEL